MAIGMCASVCAHVVVVVRAKWFKFLLATLVVQAYWSASFWEQNSWSKSFSGQKCRFTRLSSQILLPQQTTTNWSKTVMGLFPDANCNLVNLWVQSNRFHDLKRSEFKALVKLRNICHQTSLSTSKTPECMQCYVRIQCINFTPVESQTPLSRSLLTQHNLFYSKLCERRGEEGVSTKSDTRARTHYKITNDSCPWLWVQLIKQIDGVCTGANSHTLANISYWYWLNFLPPWLSGVRVCVCAFVW